MKALVVLAALTGIATAEPAKKDREREGKSTKHREPPAPGTKPARLLNLYNSWTHEWLALAPGEKPSAETFNRFLRDHYTNSPAKMEPRLLDILRSASKHFDRDFVTIISAFRHPKYNLLLRKKGHQVSRDSHHTHGTAVDFQLPGVGVMKLHAWAKDQKLGGVGLYRSSGFVHMDTGPIRFWEGE